MSRFTTDPQKPIAERIQMFNTKIQDINATFKKDEDKLRNENQIQTSEFDITDQIQVGMSNEERRQLNKKIVELRTKRDVQI